MADLGQDANSLAEAARSIEGVARGAVDWVGDEANLKAVGQERRALQRDFRRQAMAASRQAAAAGRPMCVGVFGPSQSGKSYLVSILARPGEEPLMARFGQEDIDFIKSINPEGGKESTGLVTRFSIRPQAHPEGYPVCLRLLSESDIIKILANTYFMDGDQALEAALDNDAVSTALSEARVAASGDVPGLSLDEVYDVQDYIQTQFRGQERIKALEPFWDEAASLAPRLPPAGRAKLFSLIWGTHEPFSALYRLLANALATLGHPTEAFCPMSALHPRETSIIDVATLGGLGRGDEGDLLEIRSASGSAQNLPRPVVAALTAELRILLPAPPRPFFEHTDLLDFPGARSRQQVAFERFLANETDGLKETFLRGKVAYLFDRYVAEQELTSMLLCIGDSAQEVATLPNMIHDWIGKTHGATPETRDGKRVVLFFVLTKFDTLFEEKTGADNDQTRFSTRLYASLTGFFGKAHEWPAEWTLGSSFKNCFWLRNPGFKAEAIIDYDGGRELSVRGDKAQRIDALKNACVTTPEVQAHFAEPKRAWDAAMTMNDGGISYLAERLEPMCRPLIKQEQVAARLDEIAKSVDKALRRYWVSDDLEERLKERRDAAGRVAKLLYDAAEHGCFGRLLELLMVDSHDLAEAYVLGESKPDDDIRIVGAVNGNTNKSGGLVRRLPGQAPTPVKPEEVNGPRVMTRPQYLAYLTVRHWVEALHEVAESELTLNRLTLPANVIADLTQELIGGARRQGIESELSAGIEKFSYLDRDESAINKPALFAACAVNNFVTRLGFDRRPPQERPMVDFEDGRQQPIFLERPPAHDLTALAADRPAFGHNYVTDWVFAFFRLVEDNAQTKDGIDYNIAQNNRLGELLRGLPGLV